MKAIYRIQNLKTGDFYIGSSADYIYRKWCHLRDLRAGKHHSPILQNSWNKHGENSFLFAIVEETDNLIEREQFYLDTLNPRYNICKKAGSPLGIKHTYEARLHMSLAHKGKKLSPESVAKRTATVLGVKRSEGAKLNMSKAAVKFRVLQYDSEGNFLQEWESARQAALSLSLNADKIRRVCRGVRNTCGKFIWKYKTNQYAKFY
jgi:group I intron endonuclease